MLSNIEERYTDFIRLFNLDNEEIENYNLYLGDYNMGLKDIINHLYQNEIIDDEIAQVRLLKYIEDIKDFTIYVNIQNNKYTFGILFKEDENEEEFVK